MLFFYLFRLPPAWFPMLGFGKAVPSDLVPPGLHLIQSFQEPRARVRPIPRAVLSEMLMFLCLLPLAHIDHRLSTSDLVTASDASLLGGGDCASQGETSLGVEVGQGPFRGDRGTTSRNT